MPFRVSSAAGAVLLSFTLFLAPAALAQTSPVQPATISLTGSGQVSAAPDMAMVTSGVISQADSARDALTANTRSMSSLIAAIKSAGIEARDIQTAGFSVSPRYAQQKVRENQWESPKIVGYQVNNGVSVRVRDLSKLGRLLDAMVSEGANNINGISFLVSDADTRRDEARTAAVADVRRKAELYAEAAGVGLGKILSITENSHGRPPQPMMMEARKAMDVSVPIETGEETIGVEVNITWEIDQ